MGWLWDFNAEFAETQRRREPQSTFGVIQSLANENSSATSTVPPSTLVFLNRLDAEVSEQPLRFLRYFGISPSRILREVEAPAETKSLVATMGWLWDFNAEFAETQRAAEYFWRHPIACERKFICNLNRFIISVGILKPFGYQGVRATSALPPRLCGLCV